MADEDETRGGSREWPKLSLIKDRKLIEECLESTLVGSLATHNLSGSRSVPLYFIYDDNFNVYFLSLRTTKHMLDITGDNKVGFSAFMPIDKSGEEEISVQMEGYALPLSDSNEIERIYNLREARLSKTGVWAKGINDLFRLQSQGAVFMKIRPQTLYYINTRLFGGEKVQFPLDMTK